MMTAMIIQARMGSSRLPGKVLMDLGDRPVLAWVLSAANRVPGVDKVVVATSDTMADDAIEAYCLDHEITCFRGSENDVLARYYGAAQAVGADLVMRVTADCPFLDPQVCGQVIFTQQRTNTDYCSNVDPRTWADGLDCELFTFSALEAAYKEAVSAFDREHVTPFIRRNRSRFKATSILCSVPGLGEERWTVDRPEDLAFAQAVVARLPKGRDCGFMDVVALLDQDPSLREINAIDDRNKAFFRVPTVDVDRSPTRYQRSNEMLVRAESVIPLGSQTFSKSHIQYPKEKAPLFLSHGQGGRVWDVDGHEYVDLVGGLLPLVLGYRDPDVDAAVREQLNDGISFSLATELEADLAETLVEIIPCAEKVRFGKNGTDATSATIRLARAHTGRDRIAVCGYHGWQDWYIGATSRNKGVPPAVRELTQMFPYNDLEALEALLSSHQNEFAAVMMEPLNVMEPPAGYLEAVRDLAHSHGALLIFDEVITGFRFDLGGAQKLYGVTPDLASFGKAMGNGMPISAVVGRADIMYQMEEVFFSGTFGGEALSLAAAKAVIEKMRREPVIETLWKTGASLADKVTEKIAAHGLSDTISLCGVAPWKILSVKNHPKARSEAIKTLLASEMLARGVLLLASHNVNYFHDETDVAYVEAAYDQSLGVVAEELSTGLLEERLGCPAIEPIFKVR